MVRTVHGSVRMFKRVVDIAKTAIGIDPEAAQVETFRSLMVHLLKHPPAEGISLGDLRARAGVSEQGASKVLAELYLRFARKVVSDGVITVGERAKLDSLAA